jgi:type IV fimbrial biogenesis protein FimT
MRMRKRAFNAGFTLIELMVVLAVAALLQSVAAPAVSALIDSVRVASAVNSLLSSFLLAPSEAIKRNTHAVVCKSVSGESCTTSGGWEQGWIVLHDVNNNAKRDSGEALVSRRPALSPDIRLTGNGSLVNYVS